MSHSSTEDVPLDHPDRWASLHTLFAECLKAPTEGFVEEVRAGRLESELVDHADVLSLSVSDPAPPHPADRATLQRAYLSLFEAMEQPFAPPVESPYKPWYGDRSGGLLGGPPASDMENRYEALGASPPPAYPADHVALLLEYGALLLDAGAIEEYRSFFDDHMDWLPAFAELIEDARADEPFYDWTIETLREVLADLRTRLDISPPTEAAIEEMADRVDGSTVPEQADAVFDP
ncbi:molecular chaperone TorD family protein [Halodesulfurarchaeum sp. HSR-GB]|uniref:TorD/DmsD family molecular chaperone n=1 Tax=Halodesulfurarchaeum sp. HSR-GB TaxID=3074077 RepID=UPI0028584B0C|nr:molecular chaperone TorD family protein [Halodesulfurarchaeum sp. HSR-GB]MDR5656875.1 molecular chaperone TorD family protein [Halodesulfurarchaeum sp. HSR-GB]